MVYFSHYELKKSCRYSLYRYFYFCDAVVDHMYIDAPCRCIFQSLLGGSFYWCVRRHFIQGV